MNQIMPGAVLYFPGHADTKNTLFTFGRWAIPIVRKQGAYALLVRILESDTISICNIHIIQKVLKSVENLSKDVQGHSLLNSGAVPRTGGSVQNGIDYESLSNIFTGGELATAEDYQREFQDTPFGLLVRKIAKLEYEAAFSEFINDHIENVTELTKPPFDKPQIFIKLFDGSNQKRRVELVSRIKENVVKIVG